MLTREKFASLLDKYVLDTITPSERSELFAAIATGEYDDIFLTHFEHHLSADNTEGANLAPHRSAEVMHKILSSEKQNSLMLPGIARRSVFLRIAAAAAIVIVLFLSVYFFTATNKPTDPVAGLTAGMKERANTLGHPLKIELEEGSMITLQPGSVIHYPEHFLPDKREVFLEGEAFFEVSKNASRPFFVYNKNIVTHVLGTSFTVRLNKETQQVEVAVRSGRVEVYERNSTAKNGIPKKNNGIILLPNQKAIYDQQARQFVPSLVDMPLPVISTSVDQHNTPESMVFEETPLRTVLGYLEKMYGVEIVVEDEDLYKSVFTGDVTQQDLYTRLDVICQSVQALYEVKGTRILIKWNRTH